MSIAIRRLAVASIAVVLAGCAARPVAVKPVTTPETPTQAQQRREQAPPPKYNLAAIEQLEIGARKAGRSINDIDRPQLVVCSVDMDRKKALDGARKLVTQYLGQQPHIMKASGVRQELLDEIGQVLTWPATEEQIEEAMRLVPDDVVQLITASGTPQEVKAKVCEYIEYGATCPILYPLGPDVRYMIDTFANGYSQ